MPRPPSSNESPIDDQLRRRLLWAFPSGLYVIGSHGEGAEWNLMTANLVMQVATEPKLLAVSVERDAVTRTLIQKGAGFGVSLVRREDRAVVRKFAKPVVADEIETDSSDQPMRMRDEPVILTSAKRPVLAGALGWIDCSLRQEIDLESHTLFIGEVIEICGPKGDLGEILRMTDTRMHYGG